MLQRQAAEAVSTWLQRAEQEQAHTFPIVPRDAEAFVHAFGAWPKHTRSSVRSFVGRQPRKTVTDQPQPKQTKTDREGIEGQVLRTLGSRVGELRACLTSSAAVKHLVLPNRARGTGTSTHADTEAPCAARQIASVR